MESAKIDPDPESRGEIYRHTVTVRVTHWLNVLFLTFMLGSGLQILNAHPSLYWGSRSDPQAAWLEFSAYQTPSGELRGHTRLFGGEFDTTGVLGASEGPEGTLEQRAFPGWATLPSTRWLAMGRRWHFFFAWLFVINGLLYIVYIITAGHLRRDLLLRRTELKGFGTSLLQHLSPRRLRAEAASGYNPLQKLSYLGVIFLAGPLIVLTGLTMSPWLNTVFPWLLDLFGGRQSARSLHFLVAFALVLFVLVHVAMVVVVGPLNQLRAMIIGRLRIEGDKG
ncbi:cytochrome b/b6 domain-containing protein [Thiohalomonas denitrificans]|uniref:cytochrome b/b6 domain-containing protein n=1 Tax=Thiohalomonas denitrificans TaxID=415747 RepID=UPI0026E950E6|nr:cytochrome b/b6 domain-containing protein [Thiohalomonas denitrificans]